MNVLFLPDGWNDFQYWRSNDPKILARLSALIEDTRRSPFSGIGKPEPLRKHLTGWWSRRITEEHRFIYRVVGTGKDQTLQIAQCRFHY